LLERGWRVQVVADRPSTESTSMVAAAVWFPTLSGPRERVVRWGRDTFTEFERQARLGVPGVLMRESLTLYRELPGPQWWAAALDDVRPARPDELVPGYPHGLRFVVPLVEMRVYLPWLIGEVTCHGGRFEERRVASLADASRTADLVVHCSGLGARTLVGDTSVVPVRGQLVRMANPGLSMSVRDEDHPGGRAYVHPRTQDCILGGTFDEGQGDIVPALRGAEILGHLVGLRPVRPTVRLEEELAGGGVPRVIHNYGHGGSGMTLAWGCADDVAALAGPGTAH